MTGYGQFKLGGTWDEPTPSTAAGDLDFEVRDVNTNAVIASQTDYNLYQKIRLTSAELSGRRIKVCAKGYSLPGTRKLFATHFAHADGQD
jgi:hypothetical protein